MVDIKGIKTVFGGTIPATTWQAFMQEALAEVPATDFNAAPPVGTVEDQARRAERGGVDPGDKREADATSPGGPYEPVVATNAKPGTPLPGRTPLATTTTLVPTSSTTSTTRRSPGGLFNP